MCLFYRDISAIIIYIYLSTSPPSYLIWFCFTSISGVSWQRFLSTCRWGLLERSANRVTWHLESRIKFGERLLFQMVWIFLCWFFNTFISDDAVLQLFVEILIFQRNFFDNWLILNAKCNIPFCSKFSHLSKTPRMILPVQGAISGRSDAPCVLRK